jgi:hypothetical protein
MIRFAEVQPGGYSMVAQIVRQPLRIAGSGVGHDCVIAKSEGSGDPPQPSTATSMAVKPRVGSEEKSRRMGGLWTVRKRSLVGVIDGFSDVL